MMESRLLLFRRGYIMSAVYSPTLEFLQLARIRELLRLPGPCVTILLPPYRPGDSAGTAATALRSHVQVAAKQLAERSVGKSAIAELLDPIEKLAESSAGSHRSQLILRSPGAVRQFFLVQPMKDALRVGGCFSIRRLLPQLGCSPVFYLLAISKARVDLLRCSNFQAESVKLPGGVESTLIEALELEQPDHTLVNRSSAGAFVGTMKGVRFGTGGERENTRGHLTDFYKSVDRGVQEVIGNSGAPLILAGVDEDVSFYRAASTARGLLRKSIPGSPSLERDEPEILKQAYEILRGDLIEQQTAAVRAARERSDPARFATDPGAILRAAFEGRVERLYINESAEMPYVFERGTYHSWGQEDLLNLAAVQTLIHHGSAWELPASSLPEKAAAAAVLRF